MKVVLFAIISAACTTNPVGDDSYPVTPPGVGGQGTSTGGGGGSGGGGGGTLLTARVCILTDTAKLDSCDMTVEAGIKVQLQTAAGPIPVGSTAGGTGIVTTTPPEGGATYWLVTPPDLPAKLGKPIIRSFIEYRGADAKRPAGQLLPVILEEDYLPLASAHGAVFDDTQGAIFARVVDVGGLPVAGATTTIDPPTAVAAWFAQTNVDTWSQDASAGTSTRGVVWYPGLVGGGPETITANKGVLNGARSIASLKANYLTFVDVKIQ